MFIPAVPPGIQPRTEPSELVSMKKDLHRQPSLQKTIDEVWNSQHTMIVDVRSPAEFEAGSIPGAENIPLLDDLERSLVGVLYKNYGQQSALEKGYEIFEPKTDGYLSCFKHLPAGREIAVFCARGGMRSQVVVSFLRANGFPAVQLSGGYKAFRAWTLKHFDQFRIRHPVILHGKTGVGKTLVLDRLPNTLDLEELAQHRGSLFGGIGKAPVAQKVFDAALLQRLTELDHTRAVFIEGESRKIGRINLPAALFKQMKSGRMVLLEASIETRARRTVEAYIQSQPAAIGEIRHTITRLEKDLGKKAVRRLLAEFDAGNYQSCFETILTEYYDRKYGFSMKQMTFELTVSSENLDAAAEEIAAFFTSSRLHHHHLET